MVMDYEEKHGMSKTIIEDHDYFNDPLTLGKLKHNVAMHVYHRKPVDSRNS